MRILLSVLLFFSPLMALKTTVCPYVLVTIPGSGTHLITKALFLLNGSVPRWHFDQPYEKIFQFKQDLSHPSYLCTHFWVSPRLEHLYTTLHLKKIIGIRDLRDVCIAATYKMLKGEWPGLNNWEFINAFTALSFDERLLFAINYEYDNIPIHEMRQTSFSLGFQQAVACSQDPNVLVIRYENLVGEKGNGTKEAQRIELKRLADFLQLQLSNEQLEAVAERLYGEAGPDEKILKKVDSQRTFRQGKTGTWKTAFNEQHKHAFKHKYGDVLLQMGYEQTNDW